MALSVIKVRMRSMMELDQKTLLTHNAAKSIEGEMT